jgi:ERCC4-type nuclease
MRLLIAPTEPTEIKRLGRTSSQPERYGADIFWVKGKKRFGIQRKQFPGDFLASLHDGRLHKEMAQMRSLEGAWLVLEGYGTWTDTGHLIDQRKFTTVQLYSLLSTIGFKYRVQVLRVFNIADTVSAVSAFYGWSEKDEHQSLARRPNPNGKWGTATSREWTLHLLQSFEGIGPKQAERIFEHFGGAPLSWDVTVEDLMEVEGIGEVRAEKMWMALR